jgi:hypothetical protein
MSKHNSPEQKLHVSKQVQPANPPDQKVLPVDKVPAPELHKNRTNAHNQYR